MIDLYNLINNLKIQNIALKNIEYYNSYCHFFIIIYRQLFQPEVSPILVAWVIVILRPILIQIISLVGTGGRDTPRDLDTGFEGIARKIKNQKAHHNFYHQIKHLYQIIWVLIFTQCTCNGLKKIQKRPIYSSKSLFQKAANALNLYFGISHSDLN